MIACESVSPCEAEAEVVWIGVCPCGNVVYQNLCVRDADSYRGQLANMKMLGGKARLDLCCGTNYPVEDYVYKFLDMTMEEV